MNIKRSIAELNRPDITTYQQLNKIPVKIVLENIRSRSNIGSVFRSADAFLIEEVILCGYTAQPPHRDIHKTALGATESVKWNYFSDTISAIEVLRQQEHQVWAIEQTKDNKNIHALDFLQHTPMALIFGNEVRGVEEKTLSACDGAIEIPQFGTKHSLNIAVCAGIVMFHANHQLHQPS